MVCNHAYTTQIQLHAFIRFMFVIVTQSNIQISIMLAVIPMFSFPSWFKIPSQIYYSSPRMFSYSVMTWPSLDIASINSLSLTTSLFPLHPGSVILGRKFLEETLSLMQYRERKVHSRTKELLLHHRIENWTMSMFGECVNGRWRIQLRPVRFV